MCTTIELLLPLKIIEAKFFQFMPWKRIALKNFHFSQKVFSLYVDISFFNFDHCIERISFQDDLVKNGLMELAKQ